MKLYYAPGACSLSPHIVAREAGLDLQLKKFDFEAGKLEDGGDLEQVNSKGCVPALELDDGQVLTEGAMIVQYLADLKPTSGLAPKAGTMERYRLMEWLNYIATELHKGFGPLFHDVGDQAKNAARAALAERFDWTSGALAKKEYLMGERFTVADAYLFTILSWTKWMDIDLGKWPVLAKYMERVGARPQVQAALKAEGLS